MSDKYDYFFTLDSVVMLDSADALKKLLQIKRYMFYYSIIIAFFLPMYMYICALM